MNPLFNMDLPVEERAAETIKQMTLEEKVSQLVYKSAAIERLGIPAYHWWNECLHGVGPGAALQRCFLRPLDWRQCLMQSS